MVRPDDLDARPGWRPASTGTRAARRKTIAGKRAAGNEGLQHPFGFDKTVRRGCQSQLMQPRRQVHEAAAGGNGKSIDGENGVRTSDVDLIVAVEGEQMLHRDPTLRT